MAAPATTDSRNEDREINDCSNVPSTLIGSQIAAPLF
jgi:hypothetical protein